MKHKETFPLSYFCMTKSTKSHIRGVPPLIYLPLSPRGDRCEHTSPTVRQLLNHGYRFETLKRRLGFAAVPCQAMANLAVQVWVRKLGSSCADGIEYIFFALSICCTPTLSCRGRRRRRPAKKHKVTFLLLALLSDQKRGKSQQGGLAPSSFQTTAACTSQSREPCVASTCDK